MIKVKMLATGVVVLGCLYSAEPAQAESPYDLWAYRYTFYAFQEIDAASNSDSATNTREEELAYVYSWYAWNHAWDAIINDDPIAWYYAYLYNSWAAHYAERAAKQGNWRMWFGHQQAYNAQSWCWYAYLYYE